MAPPHPPLDVLLPRLETLAQQALPLWDLPEDAAVRLINVSENVTYLVEAPDGFKAVLRVHREGYNNRRAIECELAWIAALARDRIVPVPGVYTGRNGDPIQRGQTDALDAPRLLVLFEFLEGQAPDETGNLEPGFEDLGAIAARCHDHVARWEKPADFQRLTWDVDAVFGADATWGDWRAAPGVTSDIRGVLEEVERTLSTRLTRFGKAPDRFNLIHGDMRFANLLVDQNGTRLIDFDDCGWGWFLYDFAAAISFIEDDPRIPAFKAAWVRGYRKVRPLSASDEAEINTFIMLRRMALLAWIGSHIEAPEPQALAPSFARVTAQLGQVYLQKMAT